MITKKVFHAERETGRFLPFSDSAVSSLRLRTFSPRQSTSLHLPSQIDLLKSLEIFFPIFWDAFISQMLIFEATLFDMINTRPGAFFCTLSNRHDND